MITAVARTATSRTENERTPAKAAAASLDRWTLEFRPRVLGDDHDPPGAATNVAATPS
jgi:hypothetical protein